MNCCKTEEQRRQDQVHKEIEKILKKAQKLARSEIKILLLGTGESGKSTFIKQMRIINGKGYTDDERREFTSLIFQNLFSAMQSIIDAMNELRIPYENDQHMDLADMIGCIDATAMNKADPSAMNAIKILWTDSGIQQCYAHRNEYQLIDSAKYYLNDVERIGRPDYIPSIQDVLQSRAATTGINEYSFNVDRFKLNMVDVGGQRSERRKWIHCFDNVNLVMFLTAISEYDQYLSESDHVSRLEESKSLFSTILQVEWFADTSFMLFLNKIDLLEEKVMTSDLEDYCPDYTGPRKDVDSARKFIHKSFLNLNTSKKRTIYSHFTCATDTNNIKMVFTIVKDTILHVLIKDFMLQ